MEARRTNFDRILQSTENVLVDFWAPWCKPCARMNPVIERLAEKHQGAVTFAKVNVDIDSDIASKFHIASLPAFVLFKDASPTASKIGTASETELEKLIADIC